MTPIQQAHNAICQLMVLHTPAPNPGTCQARRRQVLTGMVVVPLGMRGCSSVSFPAQGPKGVWRDPIWQEASCEGYQYTTDKGEVTSNDKGLP